MHVRFNGSLETTASSTENQEKIMSCIESDGRRSVVEINLSKRVARIGQHTWDTVGYWIVLYAKSKGRWIPFTVQEICDFSVEHEGEKLRPEIPMHSSYLFLFTDLVRAGHLRCTNGSLYEVTTVFTQYQLVG